MSAETNVTKYIASQGTRLEHEEGFRGFFHIVSPESSAEHVFSGEDMHEFIADYLGCCFSSSQAARIVGVSQRWVVHLAQTGELKGVWTPLGWLLDPDDTLRIGIQRKKDSGRS